MMIINRPTNEKPPKYLFYLLGDMIKSYIYNVFFLKQMKNLFKRNLKFVGRRINGSNFQYWFKLWLLSNAHCSVCRLQTAHCPCTSHAQWLIGRKKNAEWKRFRTDKHFVLFNFQEHYKLITKYSTAHGTHMAWMTKTQDSQISIIFQHLAYSKWIHWAKRTGTYSSIFQNLEIWTVLNLFFFMCFLCF